ncbi:MAG: flagellar assembly protein FliW, partial [Oscillospiraceae bacterium]|nr:flagellar assembly protein FliW [Oscillospiraceae bacterium]
MKLNTSRFGEIAVSEDKFLRFDEGIPGLEELKRFILVTTEETEPFHWFQSIDSPDIALAVVDPLKLFPDYAVSVPEQTLGELGIPEGGDMLV